jgi:hypothetical protein
LINPEDLRTTYKQVFNSPEGQEILGDLRTRYHISGTTFSPDATETAYREGQRTVVLFIEAMLRDTKQLEELSSDE